jgi:hypothetical protein
MNDVGGGEKVDLDHIDAGGGVGAHQGAGLSGVWIKYPVASSSS